MQVQIYSKLSEVAKKYLSSMTMYVLMVRYLVGLVVVSIGLAAVHYLPYSPVDIASDTLYLIVICYIINQILVRILKTRANPESQIITALILALLYATLPFPSGIIILTEVAAIAMVSKYLLSWGGRHIFNPAALVAVFAAAVLHQPASWALVGNFWMIPFVVGGGLLIVYKIKRFNLVGGFALGYLGLSLSLALWNKLPIAQLPSQFIMQLLDAPLLFFVFVMLVEPLTGPARKNLRFYYGLSAAAILIAILYIFGSQIVYSVELSLVIVNLVFRIIDPQVRISLLPIKIENLAQNIYGFWFQPHKKVGHTAGQYVEMTLPHSHPDNRGVRRYFTIASSPTEENLLFVTKYPDPEMVSSFKKNLKKVKSGFGLSSTGARGDFVLPVNKSEKILFIAGGIGITPMRSMIKYLVDKGEKREIVLIYLAKIEKEIICKELFSKASKIGLKTIYLVGTKPLDSKYIEANIPDWKSRIVYVSGPEQMVESYDKMLLGMGVKDGKLKRDFFPGYKDI